MLCKSAMIDDPYLLKVGTTVKDAISFLEKRGIHSAPVVNKNEVYVGIFGYKEVLENVLPMSARIEDGLKNLEFFTESGNTLAEHLQPLLKETVGDHMTETVPTVNERTPIIECIRLLVKHGPIIPVVNDETKRLEGIVSSKNAVFDLQRILNEAERYGNFDDKQDIDVTADSTK